MLLTRSIVAKSSAEIHYKEKHAACNILCKEMYIVFSFEIAVTI
jgi:hypothetical protein